MFLTSAGEQLDCYFVYVELAGALLAVNTLTNGNWMKGSGYGRVGILSIARLKKPDSRHSSTACRSQSGSQMSPRA